MSDFIKKKKTKNGESTDLTIKIRENEDDDKKDDEPKDTSIVAATGLVTTESAKQSTMAAAEKFAKPEKYDRRLLDDGVAKKNIKQDAFNSNIEVQDPYTGKKLTLTKAEARQQYGKNWQEHLAEADHRISLEQRYEQTKDNPWLANEDIKASSNSLENLDVVSRKVNNSKRSRSVNDYADDEEYLKKTGVKISDQAKSKLKEGAQNAQKAIDRKDTVAVVKNIAGTFHESGKAAAFNGGATCLAMSSIMNITAVINGEKSLDDALADTVVDTGKTAAMSYVTGGGLTTLSHTFSKSSSSFVSALAKSNIPGNVITAVMLTGKTITKYINGEISTQQCLLELGEKGLSFATMPYSMAVGQTIIPIPIVGAAVGALVGSMLTSSLFSGLMERLQEKELEHQERLRIIAECERVMQAERKFRDELEGYINAYFKEYRSCFDDALAMIDKSFQSGDADGIIAGANQITRKLGGKVHYDNMQEFEEFLLSDTVDIL